MDEKDDSGLQQAEGFFKRVLERIGSTLDAKMPTGDARLPPHVVGALAAAIERAIEGHIQPDDRGIHRLAPDFFQVLLTYEQSARLSDTDRAALADELASTASEYVVNRRYETRARIRVEIGADIFARQPHVETRYSPAPGETGSAAVRDVRPVAGGGQQQQKTADGNFQFSGPGGKPVYRLYLHPGGDPVTVGRAAGNRLHIDHTSVSKFHATVTLTRDNALILSDLGSTNGTYVNDEASAIDTPRVISSGDTIVFGEVPFRIERL